MLGELALAAEQERAAEQALGAGPAFAYDTLPSDDTSAQ